MFRYIFILCVLKPLYLISKQTFKPFLTQYHDDTFLDNYSLLIITVGMIEVCTGTQFISKINLPYLVDRTKT